MIKIYLCDKSNQDISARLSQVGVFMHYLPPTISQLRSVPIVAEVRESDAVKLAEAIAES